MENSDSHLDKDNNTQKHFLHKREVLFVTKHKKEQAIAPIFVSAFGCKVIATQGIDTDDLGMFSGEKERIGSPIEVARKKISFAKAIYPNNRFFLASEGSFAPHPEVPFITANHELLLFKDFETGLEMAASALSTNTQSQSHPYDQNTDVDELFGLFKFPTHQVIIKAKDAQEKTIVYKDFKDEDSLTKQLEALSNSTEIILENDLRAMNNPTRMKVIEQCADKLTKDLLLTCPNCNSHGQVLEKPIKGLCCSQCGTPSRHVKALQRVCFFCNKKWEHDLQLPLLDPQYCDICNP